MAITVGAPAAVATAPAGSDPPLNSLAFDPKVKGFTTGAAADMAQVSMMVYDNPAKMKADFARLGFNQFKFIEAPGLDQQAIIASDGKRTVVAFRGTENKTDAWVDARKKLVPAPEYQGLAHDGFLEAFRALWPKMKPELDAMRAAGQAVYVTGHSLGGALATLAAAELLRAGKPPDAVYTFGSPRVGNKGFADFYDAGLRDRTFRYVNKSDVVTRVPEVSVTGWIGTDQASIYWHVGQLHYIDHEATVRIQPEYRDSVADRQWWSNQADKVLAWGSTVAEQVVNKFSDRPVEHGKATMALGEDHRVANYVVATRHDDWKSKHPAPAAR